MRMQPLENLVIRLQDKISQAQILESLMPTVIKPHTFSNWLTYHQDGHAPDPGERRQEEVGTEVRDARSAKEEEPIHCGGTNELHPGL